MVSFLVAGHICSGPYYQVLNYVLANSHKNPANSQYNSILVGERSKQLVLFTRVPAHVRHVKNFQVL